jgi:hypothetical protein
MMKLQYIVVSLLVPLLTAAIALGQEAGDIDNALADATDREHLDAALEAQVAEPDWADSVEAQIRDFLVEARFEVDEIVALDCRATFCRLELIYSGPGVDGHAAVPELSLLVQGLGGGHYAHVLSYTPVVRSVH